MGRTISFISIAILLLAAGCGEEDVATVAPTPAANIVDVSVVDNSFLPPVLTINAGTSVRWINNGLLDHTSTAGDACASNTVWDSGTLTPGGSFTHAFGSTGTFAYFCNFHCLSDNMVGNIVVQ